MSKQDWLSEQPDPFRMLFCLQNQINLGGRRHRKLRLFACACCRRLWRWLPDERSRHAVEITEAFADGMATARERFVAEQHARAAAAEIHRRTSFANADEHTYGYAAQAVVWTVMPTSRLLEEEQNLPGNPAFLYPPRICGHALVAVQTHAETEFHEELLRSYTMDELHHNREQHQMAIREAGEVAFQQERQYQCDVLRDLYRNPYRRPIRFNSRWRISSVTAIAHTIYNERRFEDMPILADALEEAGCTNADILDHCRGPGEHVRGCWVVDLILGKE